jgi:hypothetical protein
MQTVPAAENKNGAEDKRTKKTIAQIMQKIDLIATRAWPKHKYICLIELTFAGWTAPEIGDNLNIICGEGDVKISDSAIKNHWTKLGLSSHYRNRYRFKSDSRLELPQINRIKELRMQKGMTSAKIAQDLGKDQAFVEEYMEMLDAIHGVPEWRKKNDNQ